MADELAGAFWSVPHAWSTPATRAHVFVRALARTLCGRRLLAAGDAGEPPAERRCSWCARKLREGRRQSIVGIRRCGKGERQCRFAS